jgi:hypothetical protein
VVKIIANDQGHRITRKQFDAKHLIGRKMDDQDIARDVKHWPFKVTEKNRFGIEK